MYSLLIFADDFTGALDSAVQFSKKGISAKVAIFDGLTPLRADGSEVLVVDTQSRHIAPEAAYARVYAAAKELLHGGVKMIYKKTDSALRGNIGSELTAVMDATGVKRLHFLPAYPKTGRTTSDGIHYYNGVKIENTVFGHDPFTPVMKSYIPDIVREQSGVDIEPVGCAARPSQRSKGPVIYVYDAQSDEDILSRCAALELEQPLSLAAGCAGFAEYLTKLIKLKESEIMPWPGARRMLVVSGSINPITLEQVRCAAENGVSVYSGGGNDFDVERIRASLINEGIAVLTTPAAGGRSVSGETLSTSKDEYSAGLGQAAERVMDGIEDCALAVFGGDTLAGVVKRMYKGSIQPISEMDVGIVIAGVCDRAGHLVPLVTKSGGFGSRDVILRIHRQFAAQCADVTAGSVN